MTTTSLKAGANDDNWLIHGRTYAAHRFSPLDQINTKNVARVDPLPGPSRPACSTDSSARHWSSTAIMYLTTPWNHAYAVDCKTGTQLWHYQKIAAREPGAFAATPSTAGFAAWGDRLYMATLDAHPGLSRSETPAKRSGIPRSPSPGTTGRKSTTSIKWLYSATVAPLVVKGKVILGISGAEYGIRGFLDAYDAKTGEAAVAVLHRPRRGG